MSRRDPWAGILSGPVDGPARMRAAYPEVDGAPGLRTRHRGSGFTGTLARWERDGLVLRGASGLERIFVPTPGGFDVEGKAVTLVRPPVARRAVGAAADLTASGSLAVAGQRARVARASRILVEGVHDAELVERVWGDDLRVEGVVVERLDGIDDLSAVVDRFGPGPGRRLGVLVDHLVPGSKEARLARDVRHPHVLVTGTPFVDVWEAVSRPSSASPAGRRSREASTGRRASVRAWASIQPPCGPVSARRSTPTSTSNRPSWARSSG